MEIPSRGSSAHVSVDGSKIASKITGDVGFGQRLEFSVSHDCHSAIKMTWSRPKPHTKNLEFVAREMPAAWKPSTVVGHPEMIDLAPYFNDRVTEIFRHEYRSPRSPFVSLALPKQGLGGWAGGVKAMAEIDDSGLRAVTATVLSLPLDPQRKLQSLTVRALANEVVVGLMAATLER